MWDSNRQFPYSRMLENSLVSVSKESVCCYLTQNMFVPGNRLSFSWLGFPNRQPLKLERSIETLKITCTLSANSDHVFRSQLRMSTKGQNFTTLNWPDATSTCWYIAYYHQYNHYLTFQDIWINISSHGAINNGGIHLYIISFVYVQSDYGFYPLL